MQGPDVTFQRYGLTIRGQRAEFKVPENDPLRPVLQDVTALWNACGEMGSFDAAGGPPWIERLIAKYGRGTVRQAFYIMRMVDVAKTWQARPWEQH